MRHEEEKLKLDVGYDIKSRLLSLREAEKRITVAEKGVREAREAYEAALARYQEQVGTNFDVLDASSNLTRAQSSLYGFAGGLSHRPVPALYRDGRIPPGSSTALIFIPPSQ